VRVFLTGASGFVGSNLRQVFAARGAEVLAPGHRDVDLTDRPRVLGWAGETRPDAIVHCAILNDLAGLRDRRRAWAEYVEATRHAVDAANSVDAHMVLVSTDWVFDGTQGPAAEDEPPNPINAYGFLKAACELVVAERAARGTVARVAGVQGVHRARRDAPLRQDAGFGNLVAAAVDALSAGRRFTVWDGPELNTLATPTLATDAGEMIWRALELERTGILHCCGGEHADRVTLARRAAEAFALDVELLDAGPPPADAIPPGGAPFDTRLDARVTAAALGVALPDLDTTLARLRADLTRR
jgi:dTDP-4-dehydrorhamnose reductase